MPIIIKLGCLMLINNIKDRRDIIIYYDHKYILKKMFCTSRKKYLKYLGPYQLRILQKAMPSPAPGYDPEPFFYVETDDHRYKGMMQVTPKEYEQGKVGRFYGRGGVILYTKEENCYYMTKYDSTTVAIRKAVNWSRIRFAFLVIVILLFIETIILLTLPLFR